VISRRATRGPRARRRGQSLVEFALVFPISMILLMAVFDVGRAVFAYNGLTNAAREGARLAVVNQYDGLIEQRVEEMTFGTGITNLGDPNFVRFYKAEPNLSNPTANPVCTTMAVGCVAILNIESDWSAITPIIGQIIGPITFKAESQLAVEFVCPNPNILEYSDPLGAGCPRQP
jgi:hypothetical protein